MWGEIDTRPVSVSTTTTNNFNNNNYKIRILNEFFSFSKMSVTMSPPASICLLHCLILPHPIPPLLLQSYLLPPPHCPDPHLTLPTPTSPSQFYLTSKLFSQKYHILVLILNNSSPPAPLSTAVAAALPRTFLSLRPRHHFHPHSIPFVSYYTT